MASADSTGLVKNTDFSAELLLNKVMNKQYRTQNGNTLTLGGRMNASHLDARAQSYGEQAANLAKEVTFADATQNFLTELVGIAKEGLTACNTEDTASRAALASELTTQISSLNSTKIGSTDVTSSRTANLGLNCGSISLGLGNNNLVTELSAAINKLSVSSAVGSTVADELDTIINKIYANIGVHGEKASLIHNRYDALNDLAASYANASNDQVVTEGGNPTSLLNTLL